MHNVLMLHKVKEKSFNGMTQRQPLVDLSHVTRGFNSTQQYIFIGPSVLICYSSKCIYYWLTP